MANRETYDNLDPSVTDEKLDAVSDLREDTTAQEAHDMATEEMFDTQHGDGHTFNPDIAARDGLTYTPPDDEPVALEERDEARHLPLDSERESDPTDEILSDVSENYDVEMQDRIYRELRSADASAAHVDALTIHIHNGYAILMGNVPAASHGPIEEIVRSVPGVEHVESRLRA